MATALSVLILVAEQFSVEPLAAELRRSGYEPQLHRVAGKADCLRALEPAHALPDVILAGLALWPLLSQPGPDPLAAAARAIPVILLCDTVDERAALEQLQSGAVDYVCTDRPARLGHAVARALDLKGLRESETKHRVLVKNINEVIYALDAFGVITYISPSVQKYTGYTPADLMAQGFAPLIYPDDLPAVFNNFIQSLAGQTEPLEYRVIDKAGAIRWARSEAQPIWRDGVVVGVQGALTDVTARKVAEEALAREHGLLRTVIDLLPEQIYVKDREGRFLMGNPAVVRQLSAPSEAAIIGKTDFDFVPRERAERYHADEQAILRSGRPVANREEPVLDAQTGAPRWYLSSKVPVFDQAGPVIGLVGVNHDITERKQAEQQLKRRADEFAALFDTARALATEQDLQALLRATVEQATSLLHAPGGSIYLYDRMAGDLVLTVGRNINSLPGLRLKLGEGMAGRVAQTHSPLLVDDYQTWEHRSHQFPDSQLGAIVQVPMLFAGELIGVLSVGHSAGTNRTFDDADARLLMLLAGQAAIVVNNARLLAETRRRAEELQTVNDVERATAASLEPETLLLHLSQVIRTRLNLYSVVIGLIEGDELDFKAGSRADERGSDMPAMRLKIGHEGVTGRAAASGRTVLVPDVSLDASFVPSAYLPHTRSELAVPLKTQSAVIGVLNMESDQLDAFQPELVALLETLASQIAFAIENARLFAETRRLAQTDALTLITSRGHLFELGRREVRRAQLYRHPLSVIMLDIDHFKQINDTHGHAQGDRVLQALAQCCLSQIRDIDIFGRLGGEEFVILLIETDLSGARNLAERIRESVARLTVPAAETFITITTSAGVVQFSDGDDDLDGLLGRADRALYAAKRGGRNRVEVG